MSTGVATQGARSMVALVALLVVVVAQMGRLLFPVMFELGEDWDFVAAGLVALAVFAAPVVALPLAGLGRRIALVAGSVAAGGALVVAQALDPVPAGAAMALVAIALTGAGLVVARLDDGASEGRLVAAVLLGLTLDVTLRASTITWDLTWQTGIGARIVGLLVAGALVATAGAVGGGATTPGTAVRPIALVAAGAIAALELLFLANIGFVSSQADLELTSAAAVIVTGLLLLVLLWATAPPPPWPTWSVGALGLVAVASGWVLPDSTASRIMWRSAALPLLIA